MDLIITFIGTSASVPSAARGTSATLVSRGGRRWLVDCGEGTQRQLLRSGVGLADVDVVLLTHLHGDHFLGLPGMFKTFALRGREEPLLLMGPEGLHRLMETLQPLIGRLPFHLEVQECGAGEVLRVGAWARAAAGEPFVIDDNCFHELQFWVASIIVSIPVQGSIPWLPPGIR